MRHALAENGYTDFALGRLNSYIPAAYSPWFMGWDNRDIPWTGSYNISHPSGEAKKLPVDYDDIFVSPPPEYPPQFWMVGDDEIGVTWGGSSGSALLDVNQRIRGQLANGWTDSVRDGCIAVLADVLEMRFDDILVMVKQRIQEMQ